MAKGRRPCDGAYPQRQPRPGYNPSETLATGIDRQLSEHFAGQQLQDLLAK